MKKVGKNLLMLFVVLTLALALVPATVMAADTQAEVTSWNIVLQDNVCVNFYLTIPETDAANTSVAVTLEEKSVTLTTDDLTPYGDYYVFSVSLAAAQMTDDIQVTISTDGTDVFTNTYSVRKYADVIVNGSYSEEMKNLVKHLLNYGGTAQNYFNYNTDDLANAGYTGLDLRETPASMSITSSGSVTGLDFIGCSMIHINRIGVRYYFGQDISAYTISTNGAAYTTGSNTDGYYIQILDINPQDYGNDITVTVANGSESASYTYSPMHYITRMYHKDSSSAEMKSMMQALYNYHIAALDYLGEVQTATVYDIYNLTGAKENTILGTGNTWDGQIHANISDEHKENFAFKTKLTMETQNIRLSLTAQDGDSHYDPVGYAVYLYGEENRVELRRNNSALTSATVDSLSGTYIFEAGVADILLEGNRVGKHLYVKINDAVVCEYNDYNSYLTGDRLGTKIIDFHYGASIQMDTTYVTEYSTNVYSVYDLTKSEDTVTVDNWTIKEIGNIAQDHKENAAFEFGITINNTRNRYRFSVGAQAGLDYTDPRGYGLEIAVQFDGANHVKFIRDPESTQTVLGTYDVTPVLGTNKLQFGYRTVVFKDLLNGDVDEGKLVYLSVNGEDVYTYHDSSDYLTGDSLGAVIAMHNSDGGVARLTDGDITYGTASVYDIYDLNGGLPYNKVNGTANGNWIGTALGDVNADDKENVAVKTKVNFVDQAEYRLSIGNTEKLNSDGQYAYTDGNGTGYLLNIKIGENGYVAFVNGSTGSWITSWSGDTTELLGEWELEFGYRDILLADQVDGKQIFLKKDGEVLYSYESCDDLMTGDALGTKVAMFHYGSAVQMDTTYDLSFGTANVYDIYDLTGEYYNTILGTDDTWEGQIHANISDEHKENFAFKTKLTMETQNIRLSLTAQDGDSHYDPVGYAVYLYGAENKIELRRNNSALESATVDSLSGTYTFEVGIIDILVEDNRVGKYLYVKMDDVVVCEYYDKTSYLTGDTLGTKIIDFHYGTPIQMDTTYDLEATYGTPAVYDIYDLTGGITNTIKGTDDTWEGQIHANISDEHKENFAFKTKLTMETQNIRLSLTAQDGDSHYDPVGYAVYLYGAENKIELRRNNSALESATVDSLAGTYVFEVGVVDIYQGGKQTGKHLYVKINDAVVCEYDDYDGYLTGDTLGTKIIDFHYGTAIQMDTTYEFTYGDVNIYDISDLTGETANSINGTGNGNWSATVLGNFVADNKENVEFRANVTFADAAQYRFSLGALDTDDCVDPAGYGCYLTITADGTFSVSITRSASHETIASWSDQDATKISAADMMQFGYRDIVVNDDVVGKQVYLKYGSFEFTVDDVSGYLTGDALGTKVAIFHYGTIVQMDTTVEAE